MSLKSDLENAKKRQKEADAIRGSVGNDLLEIAERILKGETTGNALDDFCIVHSGAEGSIRKVDESLNKYRKDLVLLVHEHEIQTSCSITHGTYDWVQDFTLGVNLGHAWDVKKGELIIKGKFAERKYRGSGDYKAAGDELRLNTYSLASMLTLESFAFSSVLSIGDRDHLFVGDEAKDILTAKSHSNWHAWFDLKNAFGIIGYRPRGALAKFAKYV